MKTPKLTPKYIAELLQRRPEIPDGQDGGVKVDHKMVPGGECVSIVSMRNSILMGIPALNMRLASPLIIRTLREDSEGTWMTDQPQELWQMDAGVKGLRGRVLIGGLGLGVASTFALQSLKVSRCTTVELNPSIMKLVMPWIPQHEVVQEDIYQYLRDLKPGVFDSAFLDTWQTTREYTWRSKVVPLCRMTRGKIKNVKCWLEEEMHGQLREALNRVVEIDHDVGMPDHYRVFTEATHRLGIKEPSLTSLKDADPMALVIAGEKNKSDVGLQCYMANFFKPGTDAWEREFGDLWDQHVKPEEA